MRKFLFVAVLGWFAVLSYAQTTQPSADQIEAQIDANNQRLAVALQGGKAIETSEARKQAANAVVPELRSLIGLFYQLRQANPDMEAMITPQIAQLRTLQLVFSDSQATTANSQAAAHGDASALAERAVADYLCANDDEARLKAVNAFGAALKKTPANDSLISLLSFMIDSEVGGKAPSEQINAKFLDIAQHDAAGVMGQQIAQILDTQIKLRAMVGKPITLAQVTADGSPFTTADWKGKVILVDYWATWCPTCIAELPEVQKLYQQYHKQGLEVVGISSDNGLDDLKKYLGENPGMVWPQLFNPKAPGMNVLATQYGINTLPVMFLIDRNGILRAIAPEDNITGMVMSMDEMLGPIQKMIPELLAEKTK